MSAKRVTRRRLEAQRARVQQLASRLHQARAQLGDISNLDGGAALLRDAVMYLDRAGDALEDCERALGRAAEEVEP